MRKRNIELWNLHDGVSLFVGAQSITNILGRLTGPDLPEYFTYSLNGGKFRKIYVKRSLDEAPRLIAVGDFNIDTLTNDMLDVENLLSLKAEYTDGEVIEKSCHFSVVSELPQRNSLRKRLETASFPEQIGQEVDGGWNIVVDEHGTKCVELVKERAGYDRIILLTDSLLKPDYTIRARLCVTMWTRALHHVGFVFQWNPHLQGDGTRLPNQWSTGLAHYHSGSMGLRFRVGVDVHYDRQWKKVGGHNFSEATLSYWRAVYNRILKKLRIRRMGLPQLARGKKYDLELDVTGRRHSLTVWPSSQSKPQPQVVVEDLPDLLPGHVAGIVAHYATARIYEFEIEEH